MRPEETPQTPIQRAVARNLIESAMAGVVIIVCRPCRGLGEVGLPSLRATCPTCRGCGETTTNELEVESEAAT